MSKKANSVNIERVVKPYHHGDLRAALIAEGLRLLTIEQAEKISLREIARNVGVSPTAVYRHFPDKRALLKACCLAGDTMLAEASRAAKNGAGGGRPGFEASGQAYVRFALDNPALFRLMMSSNLHPPAEQDWTKGGTALVHLLDDIAELTASEHRPDLAHKRRIGALQSWAIVHGLATLMLDGLVMRDDALVAEVIRTPGVGQL